MSERLGCCTYSFQIQSIERQSMHAQPHERPEVIEQPWIWTCQFLDFVGDIGTGLPPPVERANGGFILHPGDCERCSHFYPAAYLEMERLLKNRRRRRARRNYRRSLKVQKS